MGDDARREAERRWRESGSVEDGRRYVAQLQRAGGDPVEALRVRMAIGALHEERARLAAHVGHPVARAALGLLDDPPTLVLSAWAHHLFDWGQAACVRAALAGARAVVVSGAPASEDVAAALAAAEAWLSCPCPRHYREAEAWNARRADLPAWAWQTVTAAHCPPRACWHHGQALADAARLLGEEVVRAAVREALVAWALPDVGGDEPLERPTGGSG